MSGQGYDREAGRRLAAEIFRHCLLKIVACQKGCESSQIDTLVAWERIARSEERNFKPRWTALTLAYQKTKEEKGNPNNLRALLAYNISHTPELGWQGSKGEGNLCKCGGEVDHLKRRLLLERIEKGFRLSHLRQVTDCDELIGTHLTEAELSTFTGHIVNPQRTEKIAREYFDQLLPQVEVMSKSP